VIGALVRKELLGHLRTLRLVVALVFTVALCLLTSVMGSLDFSSNVRAYEQELEGLRRDHDEAAVYGNLRTDLVVPPQPLQILCRGVVQGAGMSFDYSVGYYRRSAGNIGASAHDDLMNTLTRVDFVGVVALVLSFLAIVLGFDAVCGEREQGTLRLLLANSVSRGQIVAAKLLGGFLSVWAPVAVAFVAGLLLLRLNADVDFSGDDWIRLILLFLVTCLFLAEVYALSVLVSTYARRAATSLIVCLLGWLVLGAGYGSALPMLARYTIDFPPWQEFVDASDAEWERYRRDMDAWEAQHPSPGEAYLIGYEQDGLLRYMHPAGRGWRARRERFAFARGADTADRVVAHRDHNQMPLAHQQYAVDRWAVLSPFTGYQVLGKWLTRATLDDKFFFVERGVRFRRDYIAFLRQKMDEVGWHRWFSDDLEDTPSLVPDPEIAPVLETEEGPPDWLRARLAWAEARFEEDGRDPRRRLDVVGLPELGADWRRSLPESLERMLPGLVIMIVSLGLAVVLAVRRFHRYELM
jgi:ABC-type transport system involved in multi-copper enzyme maturation permease subunit